MRFQQLTQHEPGLEPSAYTSKSNASFPNPFSASTASEGMKLESIGHKTQQ